MNPEEDTDLALIGIAGLGEECDGGKCKRPAGAEDVEPSAFVQDYGSFSPGCKEWLKEDKPREGVGSSEVVQVRWMAFGRHGIFEILKRWNAWDPRVGSGNVG